VSTSPDGVVISSDVMGILYDERKNTSNEREDDFYHFLW